MVPPIQQPFFLMRKPSHPEGVKGFQRTPGCLRSWRQRSVVSRSGAVDPQISGEISDISPIEPPRFSLVYIEISLDSFESFDIGYIGIFNSRHFMAILDSRALDDELWDGMGFQIWRRPQIFQHQLVIKHDNGQFPCFMGKSSMDVYKYRM